MSIADTVRTKGLVVVVDTVRKQLRIFSKLTHYCRLLTTIIFDPVLTINFLTLCTQVIRRRIIEKGLRVDGRQLDEVRPLYCESGTYPILHGSSLFSRDETQVLNYFVC